MAEKNKGKKKWFWISSVTLIIFLSASIGIGALVGIKTKSDENYIDIYINNQKYDSSQIYLGNDKVTDENKALMLENEFYTAALFGNINFDNVDSPEEGFNYILKPDQDWNIPYALFRDDSISNSELLNIFFEMKFLNDTQTSSVAKYLLDLATESDDKIKLVSAIKLLIEDANNAGIPWPIVTGLQLIEGFSSEDGGAFNNSRQEIFSVLKEDENYKNNVLSDMMIYTYLWQDATQKAYDYNLTKELAYNRPSIVSSITLDSETLENSYPDIKKQLEEITTPEISVTNWNENLTQLRGDEDTPSALVDDNVYLDTINGDNTFRGYKGIVFGTSAGTGVASDWTDASKTWNFIDNIDIGDAQTKSGTYSHENVLETANFYIADNTNGANGLGALIYDSESDVTNPDPGAISGEKTVYAYSQLYPYMFMENSKNNGEYNELDSATYSLFANLLDDTYTETNYSDPEAVFIFDEWFSEEYSIFGEVYVSEALINHDTELSTSALNYWKNKGFYIDLSGTYESDLSSYLPNWIIIDESDK